MATAPAKDLAQGGMSPMGLRALIEVGGLDGLFKPADVGVLHVTLQDVSRIRGKVPLKAWS